MKLIADRLKSNEFESLSECFVSNDMSIEKVCDGLEDEYRDTKLKHETRLSAGIYKIKVRTFGGFHERYKKRFPDFHQGMLEIVVPKSAKHQFTDVLIHCGVHEGHTSGCYLVGNKVESKGRYTLKDSPKMYEKLYKKVIGAALAGELEIEFRDLDRL